MARISGVDIPNKHLCIALTYIYGIGKSLAAKICKEGNLDPMMMANDLTQEQIAVIRDIIEKNYKVEGRLRTEIGLNLKRLIDIGCYRGLRHKRGLPVRGQRTRTNARTRKGKKKTVANKKKA